jgi:hypothetical protein
MSERYVNSHFLDSGAFSLYRTSFLIKSQKLKGKEFFNSKEFWNYLDSYISFIKKYEVAIDRYANLDVIGNPELTWRNQKYMEDEGLHPVPVVHYGTDLKWLELYINKGHPIIGLGGLVGNASNNDCVRWIEKCFKLVCNNSNHLPIIKVHGFGINRNYLLFKFPWWSVDATNIEKLARYGKIFIPKKVNGKFNFQKEPYVAALSVKVKKHDINIHSNFLGPQIKQNIMEWLKYINNSHFFNSPLSFQTNEDYKTANFFYYEQLRKKIPKWPWPFHPSFGGITK